MSAHIWGMHLSLGKEEPITVSEVDMCIRINQYLNTAYGLEQLLY